VKLYRLVPFLLVALGASEPGCKNDAIVNPANKTYTVVHGWPDVPAGMLLGQVSGVGAEADGNVLIFRRAEQDWVNPLPTTPIADPTVLRFDPKGTLVTSLDPAMFVMPHGLTVDSKGHVWVTDVELQQVFEMDSSGNILRTWGEKGVVAKDNNDPAHFNMPTGVAFASDGSFFVSDGYGNSRVLKFGADGSFVMQWGSYGDGPGQFNVPHGIAIGPDGNVYVADRGNARVQIFDQNGTYINEWKSIDKYGRPWALAFDSGGHAFIVDGGDQPAMPPDRARIIEVDLKGNQISTFGSFGNQDGEMIWPHSITIDKNDAIYVGEVGIGKRVQKFVKQ
jgi:peptidylamidoglycolate lyase